MIVIDASVLVDFLLGRESALAAMERATAASPHDPLHAPELIEPETLNALRRLARARAIRDRRATEAVNDLGSLRLVRHPHAPLRPAAWELRGRFSAYDATYLALARALPGSLLMTADRRFATAARRVLGGERVMTSA